MVTLHDEMASILRDNRKPMRTDLLAAQVNQRHIYMRSDGQPVTPGQISARAHRYPSMFTVRTENGRTIVGLVEWAESSPNSAYDERFVSMLEDLCEEMIQHLVEGGYQPEHNGSKGTIGTFRKSFDWLIRYAKGERFVKRRR